MIDISSDIAKANVILSHIKNGAPKAINSALNRTIDGVRTDVTREVTKTYDVKAKGVRSAIKLRKSTLSTLHAELRGSGSPIPLINFRVSPNKPGAQKKGIVFRASVKRSGGKPIAGAFVAKMKSGHIGVFERSSKTRLPVKELYGPSIPQMMSEDTVQQAVMDGAAERFPKRLDHEVDRLLSKG